MGDSYASNPSTARATSGFDSYRGSDTPTLNTEHQGRNAYRGNGVKAKDLLLMPARLALALQADGWWVRSDVIWSKPNPMPESVTDRPTSAHEHVFLLTRSARYFYDADAVREEAEYGYPAQS
jgi:DNA modification methylase